MADADGAAGAMGGGPVVSPDYPLLAVIRTNLARAETDGGRH